MLYRYLAPLVPWILAGCLGVPPTPEERQAYADRLAAAASWQKQNISTQRFSLVAYAPSNRQKTSVLTVYIEGDGLAWLTKSTISSNPTPLRPLALELAMQHPTGMAAYLARPCQYVQDLRAQNCGKTYWTEGRFAEEVIASSQEAINQLKQQFGASELQLVGYSGGGAIAALVAAGRNDVNYLITVAGNLDPAAWSREHRISPLSHSLSPADAWPALQNIPQVHFIGGQDPVMGKAIAESYRSRFPEHNQPVLRIINDFNHTCCWVEAWPALLNSLPLTP